ncbi:MAG: hypothetical protein JEZ04_03520 [Spirochaetales bacterium]|nr:hypothetical protein [Spirochaetales bacterium]
MSGKLTISIKDDGIGIDETSYDKIFIPFHQLENPFTREYGGLGIGLTIVRQICDKMSAEIKVNSEHNKGSEFIIEVPALPVSISD